jgi:hypothetical protein
MTDLEELKKLLEAHAKNMERVRAAIDGKYRLPTEAEWEIRDAQDALRSAAVNALPGMIARVEEMEAALIQNERLRNALKPFAEAQFHLLEATRRSNGTPMMLMHVEVPYSTSIYAASGWFDAARAALRKEP